MRYRHLLLLGFTTSICAPPVYAQTVPVAQNQEIVVTGTRLDDTDRALKDCIARNCTPEEDIETTLAHAENLFLAGDYDGARSTLRTSYSRNRKYAATHPQLVSELSRANGIVSSHLGRDVDYRRYTRETLRALLAGTEELDQRHLVARLELADMEMKVSGFDQAMVEYDELERDAERVGRADYAALARLKSAWLAYVKTRSSARFRDIQRLARSTDPQLKGVADGAKVLLASILRDRGDEAAANAYLADLSASADGEQMLVFAPEWKVLPEAAHNFNDRWIDIAFNVEPDGRVSDVEMIRQSGDISWARDLVELVAGRVYTPARPGHGPNYRIERYTYTAMIGNEMGSRTSGRVVGMNAPARVEFLDLTPARTADGNGSTASGRVPGA